MPRAISFSHPAIYFAGILARIIPPLQEIRASIRFVDRKICAHLSKFQAGNSTCDLFATSNGESHIRGYCLIPLISMKIASSLRIIERSCTELLASKSIQRFWSARFGLLAIVPFGVTRARFRVFLASAVETQRHKSRQSQARSFGSTILSRLRTIYKSR